MPRIRTIKPEFWSDEKLSLLDPTTRLVFLGLMSLADDAGRLIDNEKTLDGLLFPNTDDRCGAALGVLEDLGRIIRYRSSSGQAVIQVAHWTRHQKVDRPSAHVLPSPPTVERDGSASPYRDETNRNDVDRVSRDTLASESREARAPTVDLEPGTMDRRATTGGGGGGQPSIVQRSDDAIASLITAFKFGHLGGAVAGLCRAARNPSAVAAVVQSHLVAETGYEPGTPAEVGIACQQYAANGVAFNAALFAGFLRRTKRSAERSANRSRNDAEARAIAGERLHGERAAFDEAATERALTTFKNAHPGEYAGFLACAEGGVPRSITLGRELIVQAQVLQMIRREVA